MWPPCQLPCVLPRTRHLSPSLFLVLPSHGRLTQTPLLQVQSQPFPSSPLPPPSFNVPHQEGHLVVPYSRSPACGLPEMDAEPVNLDIWLIKFVVLAPSESRPCTLSYLLPAMFQSPSLRQGLGQAMTTARWQTAQTSPCSRPGAGLCPSLSTALRQNRDSLTKQDVWGVSPRPQPQLEGTSVRSPALPEPRSTTGGSYCPQGASALFEKSLWGSMDI